MVKCWKWTKKSNWKKVKIQFSTHREPNQELNYAVTIQNMIIYHNFLDQIQSFTMSKYKNNNTVHLET